MSLVLLPNNVLPGTAVIYSTDTSNTVLADDAAIANIAGGRRNMFWESSDTGARRLAYVNKLGGLGCSHAVLARADKHGTKGVQLLSWSSYPSSSTTEYSSGSFAETLVGINSQDWVYPLSLSGKQAIGLALTSTGYTKDVYKFFVSNGITLTYPTRVAFRPLRFPTRHVYDRQMYLVDVDWQFVCEGLTRSDVNTFFAIPNLLSEPLFLYDADGTVIYYKLIHGIIAEPREFARFDDLFDLSFTIRGLRQWV